MLEIFIVDSKTIGEYQKYLNGKGFKYWIEWGVGMMAKFFIKCEDWHKWDLKQALNDIEYDLYIRGK
jgi:hypothetical protein